MVGPNDKISAANFTMEAGTLEVRELSADGALADQPVVCEPQVGNTVIKAGMEGARRTGGRLVGNTRLEVPGGLRLVKGGEDDPRDTA